MLPALKVPPLDDSAHTNHLFLENYANAVNTNFTRNPHLLFLLFKSRKYKLHTMKYQLDNNIIFNLNVIRYFLENNVLSIFKIFLRNNVLSMFNIHFVKAQRMISALSIKMNDDFLFLFINKFNLTCNLVHCTLQI